VELNCADSTADLKPLKTVVDIDAGPSADEGQPTATRSSDCKNDRGAERDQRTYYQDPHYKASHVVPSFSLLPIVTLFRF
jgi:hypothetical protein